VLLRELPHGDEIAVDVIVGMFIGETGTPSPDAHSRLDLPNKMVAGLLIGMANTVAAVLAVGINQDWLSTAEALRVGLGLRVAAPSATFSRRCQATSASKDTGAAFGAHGGALNRVDVALFAAVVRYV